MRSTRSSKSSHSSAKRRRRRMPFWAVTLIIVLVSLLVFSVAAAITVNLVLNKISRPEIDQEYYTEDELMELDIEEAIESKYAETGVVYPELDPAEIQWTEVTELVGQEQDLVNILLIGQDARPGETRARSDTMILVTFNKTTGDITMTSFLRDLYVQIPGYQDNRINAAYAYGGMELLDETLLQNFGVEVDANIEVNFDGFSSIIDVLGGVDIELTQAEASHLGLPAGMNHLNGENALAYARIRSIDSDFYRTERQRKVISALFNSLKTAGFSRITDLIDTILPMVTTDMSNVQIVAYATELFPMLSSGTLSSARIPADDTYNFNSVRGMSVIVADMDANRAILKETLEPAG